MLLTDAPSAPATSTSNSLLDDFMGLASSAPASQTNTQTNSSQVNLYTKGYNMLLIVVCKLSKKRMLIALNKNFLTELLSLHFVGVVTTI